MSKKTKRAIVVVESDSHGGHKLGLLSPDTLLPEEYIEEDGNVQIDWYSPRLTKTQERLQEVRKDGIEKVIALADGDPIVVLENGDLTQGNKYPSEQVGYKQSDQEIIAYYNIRPWYELPNLHSVTFAKGTDSHTFGYGSSEINLCHRLKQEFPKIQSEIAYHWLLDIGDVTFDLAHHGPGPGLRHWLHGNTARYYLRDLMYTELHAGRIPPHIVLRGHFHTYVKEYLSMNFCGDEYESWLYVLPPLCIPGDYAIKVMKSIYNISVGLLAFEVIDGQISKAHKFTQSFDTRVKAKLL